MKYAIIFASITGNTKRLAEEIKKELKESEIVYFGEIKENIEDADVYIVGSWTNKGDADGKILQFLKTLRNKKIAIFGTAGFGGSEEYYQNLFKRVCKNIDSSNCILGNFYCQGKMPMTVKNRYIEMMKAHPDDSNLKVSLDNFEEALNHPNEEDLNNLRFWLRKIGLK